MPLTFEFSAPTPHEDDLRRSVREFLRTQLPPGFRPGLGLGAAHDPDFSRALAGAGFVGMAIPTEFGGHNRSAIERFVVTEELLAAGAPIGAHYIADRQTAPALLRFGTAAQQQRFLPAIAAGECYFSLGLSEPDAGSDLASVRTAARPVDGGWLLNGTKIWTTNAHLNHYLGVLCRTAVAAGDRHAGLSQLIVGLHDDGVTVRPIPELDGSIHFNEVHLQDVFVPDDLVLGQLGSGWHQVTSELAFERSGPDRYLSTLPVITEFVRSLSCARTDAATETIGLLWSRLRAIRWLSMSVARALDAGRVPNVEAALVKHIGTAYEQLSVELMRLTMSQPIDPSAALLMPLLAEAVLSGPGFTLRGGTTEVLSTVIAREL